VQCISKGKEHKKYEFGNKVSIIRSATGIILGAQSFCNEYDGHTIEASLAHVERLTQRKIKILAGDRGYRGKKEVNGTQILIPDVPKPSDSRYQKRKKHKLFCKRAGIEPTIGHLKSDHRLGRNFYKGLVGDAVNVLRVKASVKDFETETNISVICEDGSFYAFNVKYADEPEKLSIEMKDFLSPTDGRLPSNRSDIYFKELGNESPVLVKLMMQTIYQNDRRCIKHIGAQQFGMKFLLRGLYAHNDLLYFHTRMENCTNMPYSVDFITFKVVDKKMAKRTAIQEQVYSHFVPIIR